VIAEHDNKKLNPSTLNTVTAAKKISDNVTVLVAGDFEGKDSVAKQASKIDGVSKVLLADKNIFKHKFADSFCPLVKSCLEQNNASHILVPSSGFGKDFVPRLASLLDVAPITDVTSIKSDDTFVRPIYAGNAMATVQSSDKVKLLTVRTTSFDKAPEKSSEVEISKAPDAGQESKLEWIKDEMKESSRPDLSTARAVVSGGRGMKSGENFKLLEELADLIGAAVGASRAAVDAGYVSNDLQVGQTGKIVAPELYIAVGISGAIQHLAGMKDSKVIVAINKDPEAPIFQVADFGLVGDLFQVVPEMTKALKK